MRDGSLNKEFHTKTQRDHAKTQRKICAFVSSLAPLCETSFLDPMRFSSQVAWTFATRLLMIFNSVAAGIIVAHWLGADGLGQLAVINVTVATIVQLGSFGLPSSNTYFIAQDQQHF